MLKENSREPGERLDTFGQQDEQEYYAPFLKRKAKAPPKWEWFFDVQKKVLGLK